MDKKNKKGIKMMGVFLASVLVIALSLAIFLLIKSPGKPDQFCDAQGEQLEGSLSEKIFVKIGGVEQGMFIESKNTNNPVLLYVHGGPSFPNYFLIDKFKPGLEDYFTVCYWEQRGGGLSFSKEVTVESMNFGQLSSDAIEVTNYLRKRFGKDKIYIVAHSGGTPIALNAVAKAPELFHAYIAMAQITNQVESEKIAYRYMIEEYKNLGNRKAVDELLKFNVSQSDSNIKSFYKSVVRDKSMHQLGIGTMHRMNSVFWDIFIPVWTCKAYTLREKLNIWKSKFTFLPTTNLLNEMLERDFAHEVPRIEIPVYFISGKYDLTVNINLGRAYFNQLKAPLKGFYTFEYSAHSPIFEETANFRNILVHDVLKQKIDLADKD